MVNPLAEILSESYVLGSYSPVTNVIRWNVRVPGGPVLTTWAHEFAHFMQFNGTTFGVAWHYLARIRTATTLYLLGHLPRPIRTPIASLYGARAEGNAIQLSETTVDALTLWSKADTLLKILMGEVQCGTPAEAVALLEGTNPLFGAIFGDVRLGPTTCLMTDLDERRKRGDRRIPGYLAPQSPPGIARGAFGALDVCEAHAAISADFVRQIILSHPGTPDDERKRHQRDAVRRRRLHDEYAHALSYYVLATGEVDWSFTEGVRHDFPEQREYSHFARCGRLCFESLMFPVFRNDRDREREWSECHPGWRFFRLLDQCARTEVASDWDVPSTFAEETVHKWNWTPKSQVVAATNEFFEKDSAFPSYDTDLMSAALRINRAYPDFGWTMVRADLPQGRAFRTFLQNYPVLLQTDAMHPTAYETLARAHDITPAEGAVHRARTRVVDGMLAALLLRYMIRQEARGVAEYAAALAEAFPDQRSHITEALGDVVALSDDDFL